MVEKTRIIEVYEKGGTFSSVFRKFTGTKQEYNKSDMSLLRKLLSNEKARLLHVIKLNNPNSIYALAKFLGRDFKSVREEVLLLKKFGFIDLVQKKDPKSGKISYKPIINATTINIVIRI